MANRARPIRIEICVTEQERQLIRHKMAQLGTKNVGAYARKKPLICTEFQKQYKGAGGFSLYPPK